jgi:hypothetical protein
MAEQAAEWLSEPNELSWTDEKTGYACHIVRNGAVGHLCGYVHIPEGHPLHGIEYSAALPDFLAPLKDVVLEGEIGNRGVMDVFCLALGGDFTVGLLFNVHGGITFSGVPCGQDAGFWYGFDCGHCDDLSPRMGGFGLTRGTYRNIAYVQAECASLAKQLKQVAG